MAPLRSFSLLLNNKFSREIRDNRSSFILNIFWNQIVLEHRRVRLRNVSILWNKTFITGNRDTPLLCMNFSRYPKLLIHQRVALPNVSKLRGELFSAENSESRSFFFRPWTFLYQFLSENQKGSSTKCFGTVRQKDVYAKPWYPPPLLYCIFCYQKVSETQKASEFWKYEKFQYCERQKYSTENWAALSLTQRNSETGNFLEHKRGPLRNVSALWDN